MTTTPPVGDPANEIRSALVSLQLSSLAPADRDLLLPALAERGFVPQTREAALYTLADHVPPGFGVVSEPMALGAPFEPEGAAPGAPSTPARTSVPRLVIIDALVRAAFYQPDLVLSMQPLGGSIGSVWSVLENLVVAAPPPADEVASGPAPLASSGPPAAPPPMAADPATTLLDALRAASQAANLAEAWDTFVGSGAAQVLSLSPAETSKPTCRCSETVTIGPDVAQVITVEFTTSAPVARVAPYANPRRWPGTSIFFRDMILQSYTATKAGDSWIGTFEEVVEVIPGSPWNTPLQFVYETRDNGDEVRSTYKLICLTPDIAVDQGYVRVRKDPADPNQTLVTVLKVVTFVPPYLKGWPRLVCELFWGEMCVEMAVECSGP